MSNVGASTHKKEFVLRLMRGEPVVAESVCGLTLRMDNGSQYLSDHFQNQIKFWGIAPGFAFVSLPQTNGVVERFKTTLKEQTVYGRTYRNIEELRSALMVFMKNFNPQWQIEKLSFRSPNNP